MTSLTDQMYELKRQQNILADKIIEESEKKGIKHLEELNEEQNKIIEGHIITDVWYLSDYNSDQHTRLYTKPRFDVILEILKKLDKRVQDFENKLSKINSNKDKYGGICNLGFLNS